MNIDPVSGVRNAEAIVQYAIDQADLLKEILSSATFPLVIGGDCSILIGNTLALKGKGKYALFFLDGHTDFSWPGLSKTAGAAGMDLAIVTGHGHDSLSNIKNLRPYIAENNAWCVGNRDYSKEYVDAIESSHVNYIDLHSLRSKGITKCINRFLDFIDAPDIHGFWIHFDVDALNDEIMPAVDSRAPGGLHYDELERMLVPLLSHKKAAGLELTILDPDLDKEAIYTGKFIKIFIEILNAAKKSIRR
jgi:arginase